MAQAQPKSSLSEEQIKEFREAFNIFDKDGDETISTPELLTVMRSLGYNPTEQDVMGMIREVDVNGNGKIEFSEFLELMERKLNSFESEELIRAAFQVIDQNGDGYITLSQLRHVVASLGLDFSDEDLVDMIEEADPSGDGRVTYKGVTGLFRESELKLNKVAVKKWQLVKKGRSRITNPTGKKGAEPLHRKIITPKSKIRRVPGQVIEKRERNKEKFNKLSLGKVSKEKVIYKTRPRNADKETRTPRESKVTDTPRENSEKQRVTYIPSNEQTKSVPSSRQSIVKITDDNNAKRSSVVSVKAGETSPNNTSKRGSVVNTPQISAKTTDNGAEINKRRTSESHGRLSKQSINTANKLEAIPASPEPREKGKEPYKRNITSQSHYKAIDSKKTSVGEKPRSASVNDQYNNPGPSGVNTKLRSNQEFRFKASSLQDRIPKDEERIPRVSDRQQNKGKAKTAGKSVVKGKQVTNRKPKGPVKVNSFLEEETADGKKLKYKLVVDTDEKSVQAEIEPEYDDDFEDEDDDYEYSEDYDDDYDDEEYEDEGDDEEEQGDNEADTLEQEPGVSGTTQQPVEQEPSTSARDETQDKKVPLPPIETTHQDDGGLYDEDNTPRQHSQSPQRTNRRPPVHERLYDPDFRKNRGVPTEPEPVYVREFKSKPPKNLEHVKSRHLDQTYFEPRGEYVLESDDEHQPSFRARPPKQLEHVQSRILNPEYFKKKEYPDSESDRNVSPTFTARPPKGLQHVQSRILDPRYFEEKKVSEDAHDKYNTEFKARLPKKLEHVQPRLLDPKKPKPQTEEEVFKTNFKAHVPKSMGHVESRIMDPSFYEPKPEYVYENEEEFDTAFKAKLPKNMQHVDTRIYDERFYKKKIPPISADQREAETMNTDFKARPPKALQHVQSKFFDLWYEKAMSPGLEAQPMLDLKRKGSFVLINVKKDSLNDPKSPRGKAKSQPEKWRREFEDALKPGYKNSRMSESLPERLTSDGDSQQPVMTPEKKKPWKPKKKKVELVDRSYFDSWVMTPTHIYTDNNDMFDKNRQNVSNMWHSFAKSVAGNDRQMERYDKHLYY